MNEGEGLARTREEQETDDTVDDECRSCPHGFYRKTITWSPKGYSNPEWETAPTGMCVENDSSSAGIKLFLPK